VVSSGLTVLKNKSVDLPKKEKDTACLLDIRLYGAVKMLFLTARA
jgi:hypothetical protein